MGPRIANCESELAYWHKLFDRTVNMQVLNKVEEMSTGVADMSSRIMRMEEHIAQINETTRGMKYSSIFSEIWPKNSPQILEITSSYSTPFRECIMLCLIESRCAQRELEENYFKTSWIGLSLRSPMFHRSIG